MRKHFAPFLAIACLGFAQNALAQHSDNFESAPDPTPDSWQTQNDNPGQRTDSDPANTTGLSFSAQPGQWFQFNKSGNPIYDIQVTTFSPPGAAGGNNYLRIHRSVGADQANIAAVFNAWNMGQTAGQVTAEWDTYIPAGQAGFVGGVYVTQFLDNDHSGGTTGSLATLFFRADGSIRQSFGGFGNNPDIPDLTAPIGSWHHWRLVNDLDAQRYTLTVNGITSPGSTSQAFNFPYVPNGGAKGLVFNGQEGKEWYIDNVNITIPEPASLGLLAVAGVGLLRRRGA